MSSSTSSKLTSQFSKSRNGKSVLPSLALALQPIVEDDEKFNFDDGSDKEYSVLSAARRQAIEKLVVKAQALDLCFLMDATGSMQEYFDMVKEEVAGMVAAIRGTYPACRVRVSCVIYRDYGDDINDGDRVRDFTSDFGTAESKFEKYLSSVRAVGGGDAPEDIFTGLERVAQLDWEAATRLLMHIGDAPCRGTQFHNFGEDHDDYPKGDKLKRNIADLLRKLHRDCSISQYRFCHLNGSTKKMIQEFKKAIQADEWIQDVSIQKMGNIPEEVIRAACGSISKTLSTSVFSTSSSLARDFKGLELMTNSVVTTVPDWKKIAPVKGRRYKHKSYGSLDTLFSMIKKRDKLAVAKMQTVQIKIATHPFSPDGATRWPFHASILDSDGDRSMVVKRFKGPDGRGLGSFNSEERYQRQMEVQTVAAHLASEFNNRTKKICSPNLRTVEFLVVSVLNAGLQYFNVEKFLKGEWIRYSTNAGYVNNKEHAQTLEAFTHWTYERSGGLLMVTDLQGVVKREKNGKDYKFLLSDPAIHCRDLMRFSATNLGDVGFNLFFLSHECNDMCDELGLKKLPIIKV